MKKIRFIIPFVAAVVLLTCFTMCHKEEPMGFEITCLYPEGCEDSGFVANAHVFIDTNKYHTTDTLNHVWWCDTILKKIEGLTDANGFYEFKLMRKPALLEVTVKTDTVWADTTHTIPLYFYSKTFEIQVNEGEVTKKEVVLDQFFPTW